MHYQRISERSDADNPPVVKARTRTSGLAAGTIIQTLRGETAIEDLKPGDRIISRDTGTAVLREVRRETLTVEPVLIMAGSIGHTRPEQDVILPPDTPVHIRDWRAMALYGQPTANVAARRLVDGEFVIALPPREMTVYGLIFDAGHVIYATGLEVLAA